MDQYQRNRQASNRIMSSEANKRILEQHPASPRHLPTMTSDVPDTPNTTISAIMGPGSALEQENAAYAAAYRLHAEAQARIREHEQERINKLKQHKDKAPQSPFGFMRAIKTLTPNRKKSKSTTELNTHGMRDEKHKAAPGHDFNQHRRAYMMRHRPTTPSSAVTPRQVESSIPSYSISSRTQNEIDTRIHTNAPASQQPVSIPSPYPIERPLLNHTIRDSYSIALGRPITDAEKHQMPSPHPTPTTQKSHTISGRSHLVSRPSTRSHQADVENSIHDPTSQLARSISTSTPVVKINSGEIPDKENASVAAAAVDQTRTTISDAYIVAAFDGVHLHMEDIKREVMGRMDALEEKMDRVLALLSAPGGAAGQEGEQQRGSRGRGAEEVKREREIRPNLEGLPPHIPYGGMEGWFHAVRE